MANKLLDKLIDYTGSKNVDYTGASAQKYIDSYTNRPEDMGTMEGLMNLVDKASWVAPPLKGVKAIKGMSMLPMLLGKVKKTSNQFKVSPDFMNKLNEKIDLHNITKKIEKTEYFKTYEEVLKMQNNPKIKKLIANYKVKMPNRFVLDPTSGMKIVNPIHTKHRKRVRDEINKIEPNFFKMKQYILDNKSKYSEFDMIDYLLEKFVNKLN